MSGERFHHQSIIRRGNHFIRLDYQGPLTRDVGWVLIDGPWYEGLMGYRYNHLKIVKYRPCDVSIFEKDWQDRLPIAIEYEELIWERIWWHPGTIFHPRNLPWYLQGKWSEILNRRQQQGWRLLPDGRLPAFFNHPEWIEDEWVARMLIQQHG